MPRRTLKIRETVSLYEAKTNLSALVERVTRGVEIVITKSGTPKARLVPLEDTRPLRVPGRGKGKWKLGPGFDEPLPQEILDQFSSRPK